MAGSMLLLVPALALAVLLAGVAAVAHVVQGVASRLANRRHACPEDDSLASSPSSSSASSTFSRPYYL